MVENFSGDHDFTTVVVIDPQLLTGEAAKIATPTKATNYLSQELAGAVHIGAHQISACLVDFFLAKQRC